MEAPVLQEKELHPSFLYDQYQFRKKVFKLFGETFHVFGPDNDLVLCSKQKAFKAREDFRIYADESCEEELIKISTPQIIDFSAVYFVEDSTSGKDIGAIRRKGMKSMIRDEWVILSNDDDEIGKLRETSLGGAILSRIIKIVPQKYAITAIDGTEVARVKQRFNPFVLKYSMEIEGIKSTIDPRLLVAAGILLAGIEGRQGDDKQSRPGMRGSHFR